MKETLRLLHVLLIPVMLALLAAKGWGQSQIPHSGAKPSVIQSFGNVYINNTSDYKNFNLFGANLNSNVTVGPCSSYSFSAIPDGTYAPIITLSPSNGRINEYIYIKFSPDAVKKYNGSIPVSGGGAISFNVAVSGAGVSNNSPNPFALTKFSIQLLSDDGGSQTVDGLTAVFGDKYSASIGDEDSYKFANEGENLAINRNGTMLSIEGRPSITANDTLPLQMWQLEQKKYCLKFVGSNFSPWISASLKDAYSNTETPVDLASTTIIPFTNDSASFAPGRFSVIFKAGGLLPLILTNVKAYQKDKGIQVDWKAQTETNIDRYEVEKSIDGHEFHSVTSVQAKGNNAQTYNWFDPNVNSGNNYYRIKVTEKSLAIKYSQVVKINISKGCSSLTVFPNPVRGNVIGLQISNLDKGSYTISLYNNAGQKSYAGLIDHNGGSAIYSILTGRQLIKGIYSLHVSKGQTTIDKMVMVE